jgi:uncharacterized protein
MKTDSLAGWKAFLASPDAPDAAMSALELEGYLTGLVVLPEIIPPSLWMPGLWAGGKPLFGREDEVRTALASVIAHYNSIGDLIDTRGPKWKPIYFAADGTVDLESCRLWVRGFWKAWGLAPASWRVLAFDKRTQPLLEPFGAFVDPAEGIGAVLPDDIDEIRRACGAELPLMLPALRAFAQMQTSGDDDAAPTSAKVGRNAPCPCGSGKKYKTCCGLN